MPGYDDQWNRTNRWFAKFERADPLTTPNCDDVVFAFFQNSWHLKDWIKNDSAVPLATRKAVEGVVAGFPVLLLCADIANGSKHLELQHPRTGAAAPELVRSLTVIGGDSSKTRLDFYIVRDDGDRVVALELAHEVIAAWQEVLAKLGLKI